MGEPRKPLNDRKKSMTNTETGQENFQDLFIRHTPNSATAGSARNNAKNRYKKGRTKEGEERRKNGSWQRVKNSTPTLATDDVIREEE